MMERLAIGQGVSRTAVDSRIERLSCDIRAFSKAQSGVEYLCEERTFAVRYLGKVKRVRAYFIAFILENSHEVSK
jgi:hypothetical protein